MRRPASVGLAWQVARWTRVVPGRSGMAFIAVVPVALFVPLGSFGLFENWRQGAGAILLISTVALAIAIGRDTAVRQPAEFWIYQKGLSLADWAMGRWLLDAGFALVVMLVWIAAWAVAASGYEAIISVRIVASMLVWMASLYLMTTAVLFAVGATGSQRGTEYCFFLLLLASIEPVLTRFVPPAVQLVVRAVLPPVLPALNSRVLLSAGESLRSALPALLHVGAYVAVLLGIGAWLLSRRNPEETS